MRPQPVIRIQRLTKTFGKVRALDGLDLDVAPGEVHGFLGPNGAGKTTTIRIVLGLMRASGGHVELFGGDPWRQAATLHARLAYVAGEVALWSGLTGGQCLDVLGATHGGLERGSPSRAHRAVRPRPDQAGPRLLQGQPAEGRAHRGARRRCRAARARRADLRARPAHGRGLPGGRPRAAQGWLHGPAVESHPRRGRGPCRPGEHHPPRPDRDDRHPRRAATAYPHPRPRGDGRRARRASPTRRASRTTSRHGSTATSTAGSPSTPSTSTTSSACCTPHGSTRSR